jgi:hypothetical protein
LIAGCGGVDPMEPAQPEPDEPAKSHAPLMVRELTLMPACYLPIVAIGECPQQDQAVLQRCLAAREFNRTREEDARTLLSPFMEMVSEIRSNPVAESWVVYATWPDPHEGSTEVTVTAENRDPTAGAFNVYLHHQGSVVPAAGGLPEDIDEYQTHFGLYSPNFTMIDLGEGILRWTQWAVDISGGFYRGCDPETGVSFDQRMNDDGIFDLYCWDRGGNRLGCENANLWPTQQGT